MFFFEKDNRLTFIHDGQPTEISKMYKDKYKWDDIKFDQMYEIIHEDTNLIMFRNMSVGGSPIMFIKLPAVFKKAPSYHHEELGTGGVHVFYENEKENTSYKFVDMKRGDIIRVEIKEPWCFKTLNIFEKVYCIVHNSNASSRKAVYSFEKRNVVHEIEHRN